MDHPEVQKERLRHRTELIKIISQNEPISYRDVRRHFSPKGSGVPVWNLQILSDIFLELINFSVIELDPQTGEVRMVSNQ